MGGAHSPTALPPEAPLPPALATPPEPPVGDLPPEPPVGDLPPEPPVWDLPPEPPWTDELPPLPAIVPPVPVLTPPVPAFVLPDPLTPPVPEDVAPAWGNPLPAWPPWSPDPPAPIWSPLVELQPTSRAASERMDRRDETMRKANLLPNMAVSSNVSGWFIFSDICARLAGC